MECDDFNPEILENDCNRDIIRCMVQTQAAAFKTKAWIVRRGNLDKGNFFSEYIVENRQYIPIYINVSRYRDDGTKEDKDTSINTEKISAIYYYQNAIRIERPDIILYDGNYYDTRNLFTQEWNDSKEWIFQKFDMELIQKANDLPETLPSEAQ